MPTIPSSTTLFANLADSSQPWFNALLPYMYFAGGLIIAVGLVLLIPEVLSWVFRRK